MNMYKNAQDRAASWAIPEGDPEDWDDQNKLRALAILLDGIQVGNMKPFGKDINGGDSIQRDLWRIADSLGSQAVKGSESVDMADCSHTTEVGYE